MDSFMEHMIKQRRKGADILKSILLIIAAIILSLLITPIFIVFPEAISIWPLTIAAIFYGAYRLICRFSIEYEYVLTNGELDIDKIIHRKRRKRLITIHSKSFIEFGKVDSAKASSTDKKELTKIIDASANSPVHPDYYAVFFKNGQKMKLIFNPTQKMIDEFKVYAPRVINTEEF